MGRGAGIKSREVLLGGRMRIGTSVSIIENVLELDSDTESNPWQPDDMVFVRNLYCDTCDVVPKNSQPGEPCEALDFNRRYLGKPRECQGTIQNIEVCDINRIQEIYEAGGVDVVIPKGTILGISTVGGEGEPTKRKNKIRFPEFCTYNGMNAILWRPGEEQKVVFFKDLEQFRKN